MKPARAPSHVVDSVLMIRQLKLALPPVTFKFTPRAIALNRDVTVDQWVRGGPLPNPTAWRAAMIRAGFRVSEDVLYKAGPDLWGADAQNYSSVRQATAFQRTALGLRCRAGEIDKVHQIPGLPGSFTWVNVAPEGPPYRANILVGPSVIDISICSCIETKDPLGLMASWARVVAAQLGVPVDKSSSV